ncbi:OLC1v1018583C1 [Oldenlandia corymbosa var. corymbosa]|uniref:peptidylprolyl isomerase n=1 Tax=Oldenlandia corymbosa var. corymbosa TaxID=529605 RepID=A0AAV1EC21_OLDCO|nr:OLC1v1018583C1 [Oldenlandia corymbosa var. corymbosa]
MAFWGAKVPARGTYTLQLDDDHQRLCITQATVGDNHGHYSATGLSKLQCSAGSKPPVYICALSKDKPSRSLRLEFKKSDEAVFSASGFFGFHLSGYYVSTDHATNKDKTTNFLYNQTSISDCSNKEDKVVAENAKVNNLMARENAHNSGSISGADGNLSESGGQVVKKDMHQHGNENMAKVQQDAISDLNKELEEKEGQIRSAEKVDAGNTACIAEGNGHSFLSNDQLVKSEVHQDAYEKMKEEQNNVVYVYDTDMEADAGEDYVVCIREHSTAAKKLEAKLGNDTNCVMLAPNTASNGAMTLDEVSEESFDAIRESNKQSEILLSSSTGHMDEPKEQEMKASDHFTREDASICNTSAISIEVVEIEKCNLNLKSEAMVQAPNCSKDAGEAVRSNHDLGDASHSEVEEQKTLSDKIDPLHVEANGENSPKEDKVVQDVEGNEKISNIQPPEVQDRKRIAELVEEEDTLKKKPKTEAKDLNDAISCGTRIVSNGILIETLAVGEANGKKAAPGRRVKVIYTGRLKDTGTLLYTNVGGRPFKFRLGSKTVLKGWNVGIDGMCIGERRRLLIPPELAFGEKDKDGIPPNSWLIFDIELVDVKIGKKKSGLRKISV